jgi:hypothetical protein
MKFQNEKIKWVFLEIKVFPKVKFQNEKKNGFFQKLKHVSKVKS